MSKNIELVTQYQKAVDEQFSAESKRDLVTNQDYSWDGAKTIKVYKIGTAEMNDYNRDDDLDLQSGNWSRYGAIKPIDATTESMTLSQDRSFTFMLDKLDVDETGEALEVASALARQEREVVIPEYDTYVYKKITENAGNTSEVTELTDENIYDQILTASAVLDEAMVPETQRVLLIPPKYYKLLKQSTWIAMNTDVGQDMRLKGVVGIVDGIAIVKVPANRLPVNTGFVLLHPCATVAPVKLQDFITHQDPPGLNGYLVEGRMCYDAFVLDNKKKAIYLHKVA